MGSRPALAFDDEDVAAAYACRPPYPEELYEFLADLPGQRRRALDLGCGPGKIAHRLAERFDHVDAVDPSPAMLRIAAASSHTNISWIPGLAETAALAPQYDLVTAGASIHWMDHEVLFPRLASLIARDGFIAVIEGDDAHDPPWQDAWVAFVERWLGRLGQSYDPSGYRARMAAFQSWVEKSGERSFDARFRQPVEHFIECQHSRATWSRSNLGKRRAADFGAELAALIAPYAVDGIIEYRTRTSVIWGTPRTTRQEGPYSSSFS